MSDRYGDKWRVNLIETFPNKVQAREHIDSLWAEVDSDKNGFHPQILGIIANELKSSGLTDPEKTTICQQVIAISMNGGEIPPVIKTFTTDVMSARPLDDFQVTARYSGAERPELFGILYGVRSLNTEGGASVREAIAHALDESESIHGPGTTWDFIESTRRSKALVSLMMREPVVGKGQ